MFTSGPHLFHLRFTSVAPQFHPCFTSLSLMFHLLFRCLVHIRFASVSRHMHLWYTSGSPLAHLGCTSGSPLLHVWRTSSSPLIHYSTLKRVSCIRRLHLSFTREICALLKCPPSAVDTPCTIAATKRRACAQLTMAAPSMLRQAIGAMFPTPNITQTLYTINI